MAAIKGLVIGMGVLLFAGFVVIVVTLVNRAGGGGETAAPGTASVELAAGERLVSASAGDRHLLLRIATAAGERLEVRNVTDGALISTVVVTGGVE